MQVRNIIISDFLYYGITCSNVNFVTVNNVTVTNSGTGLLLEEAYNCTVSNSIFHNNLIGVGLLFSSYNLFYNNLFNNTRNVLLGEEGEE